MVRLNKVKNILIILFVSICIWTSITSTIYKFSNPDKTEMQAFLHIPKSFILDFK